MQLLKTIEKFFKTKIGKFCRKNYITIILAAILIFSFTTKVYHVAKIKDYIFDEVYVRFTAEEFAKGNMKAWVWDYIAPKGFAYCWSHPPLGKLIMAGFLKILGFSVFVVRLPAVLAGVLISFMVFLLAKFLFPKDPQIWLIAAFLASIEGLLLVLSRIGLADTMLCLFLLSTIYFMLKKKYLISSVFFGMSISIKWTSIYFAILLIIFLFKETKWDKNLKNITHKLVNIFLTGLIYIFMALGIYLLSYSLFFTSGYGMEKFIHLQKQMYWYHTGLTATHPYQSPAISWPIDYRPVWFWVDYQNETTSNIFALGNPLIFWVGFLSAFFTLGFYIISRQKKLLYLLIAYAIFWVPWIFSPRCMFLYHYLPAIPYLCLILAFALNIISKSDKRLKFLPYIFLALAFFNFIFFYPYWTGMPVAKNAVKQFQWFTTWK
ncbi:phospholipid carrier-dependent glycosyltransferase [Candidatus Beckwithbacteria bacterium]|nr:phospholipid carrier-dependent glycosyltransferase [Candidatus Beckwithbacteria bacterium]